MFPFCFNSSFCEEHVQAELHRPVTKTPWVLCGCCSSPATPAFTRNSLDVLKLIATFLFTATRLELAWILPRRSAACKSPRGPKPNRTGQLCVSSSSGLSGMVVLRVSKRSQCRGHAKSAKIKPLVRLEPQAGAFITFTRIGLRVRRVCPTASTLDLDQHVWHRRDLSCGMCGYLP